MSYSGSPVKASLAVAAPSPIGLFRAGALSHMDRRLARGEMVRVVAGVYAETTSWRALAPWQRYLARVHAVAAVRPNAVFCLESAAALLGLPIFGDPVTVHILGGENATTALSRGIHIHTTARRDDIIDLGGILVTGRTTTAVDIARTRHHAVGLAVADAARRAESAISLELLAANNEGRLSSRGRRHARWVIQHSTTVAESALESVSLAVALWLGFEEPQRQVEFVTDGHRDRSDFWWEHVRVIGESDGDLKYDGSLGTDPAAAIRAEKARDRRLTRHATGIAHWGWSDAINAYPLRDVLLAAGLRPVWPEDTAQLIALRRALQVSPRRETA